MLEELLFRKLSAISAVIVLFIWIIFHLLSWELLIQVCCWKLNDELGSHQINLPCVSVSQRKYEIVEIKFSQLVNIFRTEFKVLFAPQVLSPITNQVLGNADVKVTKSKETITGLEVRKHKIVLRWHCVYYLHCCRLESYQASPWAFIRALRKFKISLHWKPRSLRSSLPNTR